MSSLHKTIKYIAIAFAAVIIFGIIQMVYSLGNSFSEFNSVKEKETGSVEDVYDGKIKDISNIEIDIDYAELVVKKGKDLKVETNSSKLKIKEMRDTLSIRESSGIRKKRYDLVLYLPEKIFDEVEIKNAAGTIEIEYLDCKDLELEIDAGTLKVYELNVKREANISSGAGKTVVKNANVYNLDLDLGAGKVEYNGAISGNSKIDAGVGSLILDLEGNKEEYTFKVDTGIGSIKIDDEKVNDGTIGTGTNRIDIDGGVGSIDINFNN